MFLAKPVNQFGDRRFPGLRQNAFNLLPALHPVLARQRFGAFHFVFAPGRNIFDRYDEPNDCRTVTKRGNDRPLLHLSKPGGVDLGRTCDEITVQSGSEQLDCALLKGPVEWSKQTATFDFRKNFDQSPAADVRSGP